MTDGMGGVAQDYASRGLAVIPLWPKAKEPAVQNGVYAATTDTEGLGQWFHDHPGFNVGIACGAVSGGLVVIDLDCHGGDDGPNGWDALKEWERAHGPLPDTVTALTGSGGYHLYYRAPAGLKVGGSVNRELGVDVKSDGGYIVAPPSIHPNGRPYEWEYDLDERAIAEVNENVLGFIESARPGGTASSGQSQRLELPETIGAGGRNDTLYRAGCSMRSKGVDAAVLADALRGLNSSRCNPPLPADEVEKLIRSVLSLPEGHSEAFEESRRQVEIETEDEDEEPEPQPAATEASAPEKSTKKKKKWKPDPERPWRTSRGGIQHNILARALMDRCHACIIDGAPAVWTGKRWEFGGAAITRALLELEDGVTHQTRSEAYRYIMSKAPRVSSDSAFDGGYYVQFENLTWDVMNQCEVTPTPEMLVCGTLPMPFDVNVGTEEADKYVTAWAAGDGETATELYEVLGSCMCARRTVAQAPMLIGCAGGEKGKASNGKSTYLNWVSSILGGDNVISMDIATLGKQFQAHRVVGKLANLGDDIPDAFLKGEELATFKKLVTGDPVYSDVKYGDGFEFRPLATMVFSMNKMPKLADTTEGVYRRLAFVPFRAKFEPGKPGWDPDIGRKLTALSVRQSAAMAAMLVLPNLIERGAYMMAPDMYERIEQMKRESDSVSSWVDDEEISIGKIVGNPIKVVYGWYTEWCQKSGERNPYICRNFSSRLKEIDLPFDLDERARVYLTVDSPEPYRVLTESIDDGSLGKVGRVTTASGYWSFGKTTQKLIVLDVPSLTERC